VTCSGLAFCRCSVSPWNRARDRGRHRLHPGGEPPGAGGPDPSAPNQHDAISAVELDGERGFASCGELAAFALLVEHPAAGPPQAAAAADRLDHRAGQPPARHRHSGREPARHALLRWAARRRRQPRATGDDRDRQRRPIPVVPVRSVHRHPSRAAARTHPRPITRAGRLPRAGPRPGPAGRTRGGSARLSPLGFRGVW
jgi:hypothetical protein